MIFNMRNLMATSVFYIPYLFPHFGHPRGQKGHKLGANLPITSQMVIKYQNLVGYYIQHEKFDGDINFVLTLSFAHF